ncbi:hypothetical protein [Nocardia caishijiensis]|uniref:hypothetical protein n=1 Tax=Nocardia caishijiensis TaxID=184756 RepID=UPI0019171077|nr:hypothetical protein [Nocardia caishijiensis]
MAAFAAEVGVDHVMIREPQIPDVVHFGLEPSVEGYGLAGLFPPDLTGFHDGAAVSIAVCLELVRAMLRDNGAWCRLEVEDVFAVHVGWDQYVYVGTDKVCDNASARTHSLGLFAEPLVASPYDAAFDDQCGERRPADDSFWMRLRRHVTEHRAVLLEERYIQGASRWHRLTDDTVEATRARLTPRSRLILWPDLSSDVETVLADLPDDGFVEMVWEDELGRIISATVDDTSFADLTTHVARARAASIVGTGDAGPRPLLTGVLPDSDGVLRARWGIDSAADGND